MHICPHHMQTVVMVLSVRNVCHKFPRVTISSTTGIHRLPFGAPLVIMLSVWSVADGGIKSSLLIRHYNGQEQWQKGLSNCRLSTGAQGSKILDPRSPGQLNFVWWNLIFGGLQYGTCFMPSFLHL